MNLLKKTFSDSEFGFKLTSHIDDKQKLWFRGNDITQILGYTDSSQAVRKNVDPEDRIKQPVCQTGQVRRAYFINESGFYSLVLSSRLEKAKKFKRWVPSHLLFYQALENMGSINYLTIQIITFSKYKMSLIST